MTTKTASWTGTSGSSVTTTGPASPASGAVNYDLKPQVVAADSSEVTGMDATRIMGILHGLNAGDVAQAGQAHLELGQTLSRIADRLASNAQTLAQNWQGDAAQAAMSRFQAMHDQTAQLAQQATQTGNVLSWLGNDVLPKFQNLPDPRVTSTTAHDEQTGAKLGEKVAGTGGAIIGDGAGAVVGGFEHMLGLGNNGQAQANATAQKYLTALNAHLVTAYDNMPKTIGVETARSDGSPAPVSVPPSGTGGTGGVTHAAPVTPVSGPGGPGTGGSGTGTHTGTGHSTSGGGAKGAGGSTVGRISPVSSPPGGTSGNGGSTGHLQGLTPAPGGGTPGTGGGVPGATGPGPGTGPGSGLPIPGGPVPRGGGSGNPDDSELVDESGLGNGDGDGVGAADASPVPEDAALLSGPDADLPGLDGVNGPGMLGAADPATATATDGVVSDAPLGAQSGDAAGSSVVGADNTGADMAGVPMGGASGAQQEKERRRQAWMNEDESIWGMPTDHVPPVIEGGG